MSFVGIDVGGTYVKAAAFDAAGEPERVLRTPIPPFLDSTGAAREIDPVALIAVVEALLNDVAFDLDRVDGVLVTGQMAGIAFVDAAGNAVAPLVSWQDMRVTGVEQVAAGLGDAVLARTGDGIRIGLPLVTLTGIERPAGARVTSLLAYVAGALAGVWAPVVHVTDAAAWGLLDVAADAWLPEAVAAAGLSADELPAVSSSLAPVGWCAAFDAPVLCAVGDQQAALLGAGLRSSEVGAHIATGGHVSVISTSLESPAQLRPYFGGQFLHTITHQPAGRLLTAVLADTVGHEPTDADWDWAVSAVNNGDPAAAGVLAAVDEIAAAFVSGARRLGAAPGMTIRFSGGLAQKFTPLQDRIVAALDLPYVVFDGDDAALAGLGILSRGLTA